MKTIRFAAKSKRKGITPVIAIVLLLMMTVAAAGMAYMWIMSLQTQIQETGQAGVDKNRRDAMAAVSIVSGWKDASGKLFVAIKNSGTYTFSSDEVGAFQYYINGKPGAANLAANCASADLNGPSTICQFDTGETFPATAGEKVVVKVDPGFGTGATYSCILKSSADESC